MKGLHTEKYGQYGGHNQVETYENSPYEEHHRKEIGYSRPTASPSCKKRRLDMHGMNVFIPISDFKGRRVPERLNPVKITRGCLTFRVSVRVTFISEILRARDREEQRARERGEHVRRVVSSGTLRLEVFLG